MSKLPTARLARHPCLQVAAIVAALAGAWLTTWASGGAQHVPPHLFYVPILLAATWFGPWSLALTSLAATLASGPLLPEDVATGTPQLASDWLVRGVFFLTLGQLIGRLLGSLRAAETREQRIAAREAAVAEQKAAFLHGLAHELRTPLAILAGTSNLLSEPTLGDRERTQLWPAHRRALQRLGTLVEVAVVMSDDDSTPAQSTFQIGEVVAEQVAAISRGDIDRVTVVKGGQNWVASDESLVGLLLRILIDNALRFSPPAEAVAVSAQREGDRIRLVIADRGPGLEPQEWPRLICPFVQGLPLPDTVNGLGLGLSAASRIVAVLGTDLTFTQHPGGGTNISFSLDAAAASVIDWSSSDRSRGRSPMSAQAVIAPGRRVS